MLLTYSEFVSYLTTHSPEEIVDRFSQKDENGIILRSRDCRIEMSINKAALMAGSKSYEQYFQKRNLDYIEGHRPFFVKYNSCKDKSQLEGAFLSLTKDLYESYKQWNTCQVDDPITTAQSFKFLQG